MPLHQTPPAPPERVKISKKRIVSSTIKVAPRVQPTTGVNTYYHSGNLGDVIYGLFAIKKAGGGRFLVGPEQHRTSPCDKPITQGSYDLLLPLLKHQRYLTESTFAPHYHPTGVKDLNVFRNHWNNAQIRASTGISLLSEMHFYALGLQNQFSHEEAWLTVPEPIKTGKFIVHRSARYRNDSFQWEHVLKHFGARNLIFVGHPDEHKEFTTLFSCSIQFWKVEEFLELARLIAGAAGFIGNQSFPCSLAIGLGQRVLQEAWPNSPDCLFRRNNLLAYTSGGQWRAEQLEEWTTSPLLSLMQLPTVTLLAIDVARPLETVEAMKRTLRHIHPRKSILLTDTTRWPQVQSVAAPLGIEVRNHIQSNDSITFPGVNRRFFVDYELAVMTEPLNHMGDSTHVLYMESDAGVMNPAAWDPAWLEYDYIGAPWCRHGDPGWPPCDGITNAVGNSGFSLQSRKFCENLAVALQERKDDRSKFSCDRWMCRTIRPWMEERGVKYATVEVASRFSCEDRIYDGSFGFHGRSTARINNWKLP